MMTKIIEAFKQTDDFKKELRESEKIPDFEKYLDERLSADEKTQLHKERFEIGFGSTVESKVHNMHMEFMRSDAKNNYTKFHFERTRSIITVREIESIYRAFKNEVNNNDTDRYKEPEITAKTILHLLQKLNNDLSQKIIGVLLEDNDISIQMYVWQKKDLNFSETKYRSTWEAMKRNFNLILIENGTKEQMKAEPVEIIQPTIQVIQDALELVINKKSKPAPANDTIKIKLFEEYFKKKPSNIDGLKNYLKSLTVEQHLAYAIYYMESKPREITAISLSRKKFVNTFQPDREQISSLNSVFNNINKTLIENNTLFQSIGKQIDSFL